LEKITVAVLMGGRSDEREVSLVTGRMILNALDSVKYDAYPVDTACIGAGLGITGGDALADNSGFAPFSAVISGHGHYAKPDVAFIALHGKFGEDGTVQGLLELLGIPYVGSGVLGSALAMDKIMARKVLEHDGVPIPKGISVPRPADMARLTEQVIETLGLPAVVKPNKQGSTIGLSIVRAPSELSAAVDLAFSRDDEVLIEEYVEGIEITAPVIGNNSLEALPLIEIVPSSGFYDYHSKYTPGATTEIVPARIPSDVYRRAEQLGMQCHRSLSCRGMSRTDMIVRGDDIYVLEVNTIPGMTPTSLLPLSAAEAGITFPNLLDRLIGLALERG
jgi:D-alanine-D-alanine ligase